MYMYLYLHVATLMWSIGNPSKTVNYPMHLCIVYTFIASKWNDTL